MFVPFEDEVGMDFITNDSDIVLSADFRIGTQLLFRPHTAHGVVGGAEDSRLYLVGFNFFFQIGKINFIMTVFKNKGAVNEFSVILCDGGMKRMVNRLIDEDGVIFFCQSLYGDVDGCLLYTSDAADAGSFYEPFRADIPVEMFFLPAGERPEIRNACVRVPVNTMLHAVTKSIGDAVRHFKVHVGDPKGECIFGYAVFSGEIVFKTGCVFSVNDGIKIKSFHKYLLS